MNAPCEKFKVEVLSTSKEDNMTTKCKVIYWVIMIVTVVLTIYAIV